MDLPSSFSEASFAMPLLAIARVLGFVAIGTLPIGPGIPFVVRAALGWALSIAAIVWTLPLSSEPLPNVPFTVAAATELCLGALLGLSVACVTAASAWAGTILGSISGLSWADDFSTGPAEATTPLSRLIWWVAAGAFVSIGGAQVLVLGILDSLTTLPLGGAFDVHLGASLVTALAMACRLAIALALPAMIAILAWHIAAAIACRVLPLSPSAGLLQGTAAMVLLLAIWTGGPTWTTGIATAMEVTCKRVFELPAIAIEEASP
jgi:flagellar biosynthesis protein FliR